LYDNALAQRHLKPRKNWPIWISIVLITHPILRIWPRLNITCFMDWKKQKLGIFLRHRGNCCRGDLVWRTNSWIFLSDLQKLERWAKKCIELRGECVE
jgi:hypothetical protein